MVPGLEASLVKKTQQGRVTDEHLAELESWAKRHKKPWTMGISSHVVAAMIEEIKEARHKGGPREGE